MDTKNAVSVITKAGTIIITTLTSFIIKPPALSADENEGINWKNIFVFVAGVLCILFFNWVKQKIKRKKIGIALVVLFILLAGLYEVLYYKYSVNCWDSVRSVISYAPVKSAEVAANLEGWVLRGDEPLKNLVQAYQCSPLKVWNMSDLFFPYYSMIILYLVAIVVLTVLLLFISELLINKS